MKGNALYRILLGPQRRWLACGLLLCLAATSCRGAPGGADRQATRIPLPAATPAVIEVTREVEVTRGEW